MMRKQEKRRQDQQNSLLASTKLAFDVDKTVGPEGSDDETSAESKDSTSTTNLVDSGNPDDFSHTTASLTEKYLLSGKYDVPIWRMAFLLLAVASMYLFIQDNSSGTLGRGDWWAIIWTIQKCMILSGFIFFLLLLHSFTNWIRKKIRKL